MPKFKLDLDQLSVESFDTTPGPAAHAPGTVFGFENSNDPNGNTCIVLCSGVETYGACSGGYTCTASCDNRCDGGGDFTYPPHQSCDNYENTCAADCMW